MSVSFRSGVVSEGLRKVEGVDRSKGWGLGLEIGDSCSALYTCPSSVVANPPRIYGPACSAITPHRPTIFRPTHQLCKLHPEPDRNTVVEREQQPVISFNWTHLFPHRLSLCTIPCFCIQVRSPRAFNIEWGRQLSHFAHENDTNWFPFFRIRKIWYI